MLGLPWRKPLGRKRKIRINIADAPDRQATLKSILAIFNQDPKARALSVAQCDELNEKLLHAIGCARAGVPSSRADVSCHSETRDLLADEVMDAMKAAGLTCAIWHNDDVNEAAYYKVLRAAALPAKVFIPVNPKRLGAAVLQRRENNSRKSHRYRRRFA